MVLWQYIWPVSYTHLDVYKRQVMTMKVVFEKESYRLLGAQIIGYEVQLINVNRK